MTDLKATCSSSFDERCHLAGTYEALFIRISTLFYQTRLGALILFYFPKISPSRASGRIFHGRRPYPNLSHYYIRQALSFISTIMMPASTPFIVYTLGQSWNNVLFRLHIRSCWRLVTAPRVLMSLERF